MNPTTIVPMALGALDAPAQREAKRTTQDGFIWPVARAEMRSARRIEERILEDAQNLLRQRGRAGAVLLTEDFLRLGWRRPQLEAHASAALARFGGENACGNDAGNPEAA